MAITIESWKGTDSNGNRVYETKVEYPGRVLEVRTYSATRNCSDTLDYSDYRTVEVREAFVYFGRVAADTGWTWIGSRYFEAGAEIPIESRFGWVDCTNLFVWRGSDVRKPEVDNVVMACRNPKHPDCLAALPIAFDCARHAYECMMSDLAAYKAHHAEVARVAAEERREWEAKEALRKAEEERNRPAVGKKMVVKSGRKVSPGTEGTVSYIHSNGGVLLKADAQWQDRKAPGIWVDARHLAAR